MSISFICTNCSTTILVQHLNPGEQALCKSCNTRVTVPEDANAHVGTQQLPSSSNLSIWADEKNNFNIIQAIHKLQPKSYEQKFAMILLFFSIGLIFHIFEFRYFTIDKSTGIKSIFNLSLIGSLFVLRAGILAYKIQIHNKLIIALLLICSLNTFIYIIAMFGLTHNFSSFIRLIEVLILIILYYKFVQEIKIFKEFERYIAFVFILYLSEILLSVISIISLSALIWINTLFSNSEFYLSMFSILGLMLPLIFIHIVNMLIFTYISFSMYKKYKNIT